MNRHDIERSLRNSIEQETPDLLADLMTASVKKLSGEDYIVKQRPVRNVSVPGRFAAALGSVAMICLICLAFLTGQGGNTVWTAGDDTFISIDVNPSIEMMADENNMVTELRGLNEDGRIVLQAVEDSGPLDEVVPSLVEAMTEQGYLKPEIENSILVSVENKDAKKADDIKGRITDDIYQALDKTEISSIVLTRDVTKTRELEREAEALNISVGKMSLIQDLAEKDSGLDVQQMAEMSIGDISDLAQERRVDLTEVVDVGRSEAKENKAADGVAVAKTETPTEAAAADSGRHTDADTSAPAASVSGSSDNETGNQTTASAANVSPVTSDYEVRDTPKPSAAPDTSGKEGSQVIAQEPNVVAKPVEEPTAQPADQGQESYEITDSEEIE